MHIYAFSRLGLGKGYLTKKNNLQDEKIFIRVRDNANGIEENILDKIFDFHFTTKKIKSKSSGLGLYMSQQLVKESMKGTLSVKNSEYYYEDKKYKGAEFIIQFPLSN